MTEEPDWDDPQIQDQWCAEVRGHVETYLRDEQVEHGRIAEEPTWFVAPYVALWAVESKARPETVGPLSFLGGSCGTGIGVCSGSLDPRTFGGTPIGTQVPEMTLARRLPWGWSR